MTTFRVPNHYHSIQYKGPTCIQFNSMSLNGATQRTIELSLNGVTIKLWENGIFSISQFKFQQLHIKQVLGT